MSAEILDTILRCMLAASAAMIVVLLARVPLRKAFGARAAYAFWLLVPAAALASTLSLRQVEMTPSATAPYVGAVTSLGAAPGIAPEALVAPTAEAATFAFQPPPGLLLAIWAAGVLASLALLLIRERRFVAGLDLRRDGAGGRLYRTGVKDIGPALVGVIRPRIVVPADFERSFDRRERAVMLAHERAHLAAWDAQVNGLAALIQCLGWFNPIFYLARRVLRMDQELACDERITQKHRAIRRVYAQAMLKTQLAPRTVPFVMNWPSEGQALLRERIAMMARPALSGRRRALGSALCASCALLAGLGASAAQPPRVVMAAPDAPQRGHFWREVGAALDPAFCQRLDFLGCEAAANAIGDRPDRDEAAALGMRLVLALQNGDIETARRHIAAGADVDFFLPGDGTPLLIAAKKRDYAIARLLLEAGADANRAIPSEASPLIIAAIRGDFAMVELLVEHGADVNAYVRGDETPLIRAAQNNRTSVARHLIEHGADVDLAVEAPTWRGAKQRSPLGEAVRNNHPEMIRLLREYGAET